MAGLQKVIDIEQWMALVGRKQTCVGTAIGSNARRIAAAAGRGMRRVVGALDVLVAR